MNWLGIKWYWWALFGVAGAIWISDRFKGGVRYQSYGTSKPRPVKVHFAEVD